MFVSVATWQSDRAASIYWPPVPWRRAYSAAIMALDVYSPVVRSGEQRYFGKFDSWGYCADLSLQHQLLLGDGLSPP